MLSCWHVKSLDKNNHFLCADYEYITLENRILITKPKKFAVKQKKIELQSNNWKTSATEIELFWKIEYLQFSTRSVIATNY